jgi:hypothetical protein
MSKLTDKQWVELTRRTIYYANNKLRLGQSYMNALFDIDKDLYKEVTGTDFDCFYNDDKLIELIKYLSDDTK